MCNCDCEVATVESLFNQENLPHPHGAAFRLTRRPGYENWTHEHEGCELTHSGAVCERVRAIFNKESV